MEKKQTWQPPILVGGRRIHPRVARLTRRRQLLRAAGLMVVAAVLILGPRRTILFVQTCHPRHVFAHAMTWGMTERPRPDLERVSELTGVELPSDAVLLGSYHHSWLDAHLLIAKVRMSRDSLTELFALTAATQTTEPADQNEFRREGWEPLWWDPQCEAPLRVLRVRKREQGRPGWADDARLAVPMSRGQRVNVYIHWGG